MKERKSFKIIESPLRDDVNFIELNMGEKKIHSFYGRRDYFCNYKFRQESRS